MLAATREGGRQQPWGMHLAWLNSPYVVWKPRNWSRNSRRFPLMETFPQEIIQTNCGILHTDCARLPESSKCFPIPRVLPRDYSCLPPFKTGETKTQRGCNLPSVTPPS